MEHNAYKTKEFLGFCYFGVPTAAVRARQDRLGPSLRPCLKGDPEWSGMLIKPIVFLGFCSFWGPGLGWLGRPRWGQAELVGPAGAHSFFVRGPGFSIRGPWFPRIPTVFLSGDF